MLSRFRISAEAQAQVDEILDNVAEFTGYNASSERLLEALYHKFELIALLPDGVGRLREDGTREAFARRYRIVYEKQGDEVVVLAVIHSSRLYPRPV